MTILPTAYFPPISYFSLLSKGDVFLEAHENYQKQSWRNRCRILTSNGPELLNVPVVHEHKDGLCGTFRIPIQEIKIDWSRDWLTRHKRAIDSAYMSSAYFEHYRTGLYTLLDERPERLWDLNRSLIDWFCGIWQLPKVGETVGFGILDGGSETSASDGGGGGGGTGTSAGTSAGGTQICRPDIHPKREDKIYVLKPYWQVFGGKFPFAANLSAMDLLFNEGPQGKDYL